MTENEYIFTSESVSEGHPDKICDQISDAIVDHYLSNCSLPERARVACETMVTTNKVIIAGEVRGDGELKKVDNNKAWYRLFKFNSPDKEIHIVSFTFYTLKQLYNTKKFQELFINN